MTSTMAKKWGLVKDSKLDKQIQKDPDIVMTKPEMAKYLIDRIKWEDGEIVCDPCRGKGAFYDNLPDNVVKVWYEITEGKDYLGDDKIMVNTTISNPVFTPRKLFWKFMQRAMETTTERIYWLINLSCMNVFTPKRLKEMKDNNWFIQYQHIVADKRWFGRYVLLGIGREDNGYYTWHSGKAF